MSGAGGSLRRVQCQACGRLAAADARFCSGCGASLEAAPQIAEETRPLVMSTLRGEERLVTVVFADLTESVRRTLDLSPEEATALVGPLLEAMVELMMRHGGRIDRFLGDGVLAVFGVPAAHEDDPIRAVRAAMELRERAASLGLAVTAGINTGRVYFGPVGSDLHEELTVMGPTVNLAARLQSAAAANQIMVGAATHAHTHRAFHLERVTLTVKGIDEPVTAYLAEYEADLPEKVRGIEGLRADLVGRDQELKTLEGLLDGSRHTVALIGEAGVGKSRLASELCRLAASRSYTWLEGRCLELTRHLPYGPFVDLFRRHLGAASPVESVEALVEAGCLDVDQAAGMAPFIAHLLGGDLGDERDLRVTGADPDQRQRLTISAVVDYLAATARLSPTVVFIEDLHWGDGASVRAVEQLHRQAGELPLILALAYRPGEDQPTSALMERLGATVQEMRLRELSTDESRTLIDRLLERSGISDLLAGQIASHSGGNPFYVEEIVRTLIQRGALVRDNGAWKPTGDVGQVPLPESVEGLLMSRFDRLPSPLKQAARVASVIGEGSTPDLVDAVAGPNAGASLPALVEAGIAIARGEGAAAEYGFTHALTRQAIYSSLLPSHRTELHGRTAEALEAAGSVEVSRLAHHYGLGADDAKAVHYQVAAAEQAMAAYANDAAHHHLARAHERVEALPTPDQPGWRARIRMDLGEVLERQAEHEAARAQLLRALEDLGDQPSDEAKVWRILGQTHRLQGSLETAHECYDRAEESLARVDRRDSTEAHRAWIDIQQERSLALYFGGRGRELPDHNARITPVVESYGSIAQRVDLRSVMLLDRFAHKRWVLDADDVEFARGTLELARSGTDPQRIAESTFGLGFTLLWADQVEEAAVVLEEATADCRRVGDVVHENRSGAYLAVSRRRVGDLEEARTAARASLELSTSVGSDYYRGHALATLCWAGWRAGDPSHEDLGRLAYEAWGNRATHGFEGLSTEFAWMAVWPLAASAHQRGSDDQAIAHLRHVTVPWERPMPGDLAAAVTHAVETASHHALSRCFDLAHRHRLM